QRYAKALGTSELQGESVEARMLEVEQAAMNAESTARLSQIRAQLGLEAPAAEEAPQGQIEGGAAGATPAG
ncbi:MAG TPA: hypothetical protein VFO65_02055, partial [Acidimicrobiales bacterium]|nr:hypothetical protein [Acidimicrobiales bacterium]